jgi:hypothetical protein
MPAVELDGRYQKSVLWVKTGDDAHGEPIVDDPVEIMARWERGTRYARSPEGTTIAVDHMVYVDREITAHSLLWKGLLEDLTGTSVPDGPIFQVEFYEEIPDVDCRAFERIVAVTRFRDSLPTVS